MTYAVLHVEPGADNTLQLVFQPEKGPPSQLSCTRPELDAMAEFSQKVTTLGAAGGAHKAVARLINEFSNGLITADLRRTVLQWVQSAHGEHTLCIASGEGLPHALPWEILPRALGVQNLFVARLAKPAREVPCLPLEHANLFAAGWSRFADVRLPGVSRELTELRRTLTDARLAVKVLSEPTLEQLGEFQSGTGDTLLHLISAGIDLENGKMALGTDDEQPLWASAQELIKTFEHVAGINLIVLNTCDSGYTLLPELASHYGAAAVGWAGGISDDVAADFSLYFYQRLLEGASVVEAVRGFCRPYCDNPRLSSTGELEVTVVWLPDPALVDVPIMERRAEPPTGQVAEQVADSPQVSVQFSPRETLNPALLKNRCPALERLSIESSGKLDNVRLEILCDSGSGTSCVRQTIDLQAGAQPVPVDKLHFPVLYQLMAEHERRRYVNFVVTVSHQGRVLAEETRAALWMSHNEWMDQKETWPFIPSFIQPESDGIEEVFDEATVVLRSIRSPTAVFNGYESREADSIDCQMRAIYQTLRDKFAIKYMRPLAGPIYAPGSAIPAGQIVRLPDRVIEHRRGTCHDLALLFASCAEHAGLYPLVLLMSMHTTFAYWKDAAAHQSFWKGMKARVGHARGHGAQWSVTQLRWILELVDSGAIELMESTVVTKPEKSFEDACKNADRRVRRLQPEEFDAAIDVARSRQYSIQPL